MLSDKKFLIFGNKFALEINATSDTFEVEKSLSTSFNFNQNNLVPAKVFGQAVYALGGNDFSKIFRYVESQGIWERV